MTSLTHYKKHTRPRFAGNKKVGKGENTIEVYVEEPPLPKPPKKLGTPIRRHIKIWKPYKEE